MSAGSTAGIDSVDSKRALGSYYTPAAVVRTVLDGCLQPLFEKPRTGTPLELRILDPACGDGAFILEAFDELCRWYARTLKRPSPSSANRLQIVSDHLFGVDIDADALESLKKQLLQRIDANPAQVATAREIIGENIKLGDALTGPGFAESSIETSSPTLDKVFEASCDAAPLDWCAAFPQVAGAGGFDVVVGNPPYRRELNAKSMFDRIARAPLGKSWRQARMDLWYYFLHRGLDVLKPAGRLSFVVNGYWTSSDGARRLIERLENEATFEEIVLLGAAPIFDDVSGRHLLFRIRKGRHANNCRVFDLSTAGDDWKTALAAVTPSKATNVRFTPRKASKSAGRVPLFDDECYEVTRQDLFQQSRLIVSRPQRWLARLQGCVPLGESCDVRQGMAENPSRINVRTARRFSNRFRVGEGAFVLTGEEVESLELSNAERAALRPYFATSVLGRYQLPSRPSHFVLYLTKQTARSLECFPRLRAHLGRFRSILDARRETRSGHLPWWQLHWPREERIFTDARILSVQMGRVPQFVSAKQPTYVGFSTNLIIPRAGVSFGIGALTGILNSTLARRWFSKFAKRRGVNLEISGGLLKRFPLPDPDTAAICELEQLVSRRQEWEHQADAKSTPTERDRLEHEIDLLVCRLYAVELDEISM